MKKRSISLILCLMVMISTFPTYVFAATPIGQDSDQGYPINCGMETPADVEAIQNQISSMQGNAALSQDRKEGNMAAELKLNSVSGANPQYTLVSSNEFDSKQYNKIKLYVKPKAGASWIRFYTTSLGNPVLIASDINHDGSFDVGADLSSGQWNEIELNLTETKSTVDDISNLIIQTNNGSTWGFDDIKAIISDVYSVNLNDLDNANTVVNNGSLQFNSNGGDTFNTTQTVLLSGLKKLEIIDDDSTDFTQGSYVGTVGTQEDSYTYTIKADDSCNGGTNFSHGGVGAANSVFDNLASTYCSSGLNGSANIGAAYYGYDFGTAKRINILYFQQTSNYGITSAKLQYYNGSSWADYKTLNLKADGSVQMFPIYSSISSSKWRLLANSSTTNSSYPWRIYEISMIAENSCIYTSGEKLISDVTLIDTLKFTWVETEPGSIIVESKLSKDGGANWTSWTAVKNGEIVSEYKGITLNDGKIQYKVTFNSASKLSKMSISVEGDNGTNGTLQSSSIKSISINKSYMNNQLKTIRQLPNIYTLLDFTPTYFGISGDGTKLFYTNTSDSNRIYKIDLCTGISESLGSSVPSGPIKANYDGSIAVFTTTSAGKKYDSRLASKVVTISSYPLTAYDIQYNGDIYISDSSTYKVYLVTKDSTTAVVLESPTSNINCLSVAKEKDMVSYSWTGDTYLKIGNEPAVIISTLSADNIWIKPDGTLLVFQDGADYYRYDIDTKVTRKIGPSSIVQYANGDKLYNSTGYFDLNSEETVKFIAPESTVANCQFDYYGTSMVYTNADYLKKYYLDGANGIDRYLLSFDGKNSWYTCKDGIWELVKSGLSPTAEELIKYGMTSEEVNNLTSDDYGKLYEDGREIYSIDFAIYFASVNSTITPSINGITVYLDEGEDLYGTGESYNAVYATKKQDFNAENYRAINKIYPVEITPKASEVYYFAYVNNEYKSMKGDTWTTVGAIVENADENWIEITQKGVTASELRKIDADTLKQELLTNNPNKTFSIVYCIKTYDESTEGYICNIYVDYTQDLFESNDLTLNITYNDGTVKQYAGLNDSQVEDFMAWILGRQYNKGPIFYLLKVGDTNDFINYYMIQNVKVIEQ